MVNFIKKHVKRKDRKQQLLYEIGKLNEQILHLEKEVFQTVEQLKREEHENQLLRDKLEPKSCDGCIHAENYRKCTSCARYPKLKDKYEISTSRYCTYAK